MWDLQIAQILRGNASIPSVKWPEIEIAKFSIGLDIGALELADLSRTPAGENANQEAGLQENTESRGAHPLLEMAQSIFAWMRGICLSGPLAITPFARLGCRAGRARRIIDGWVRRQELKPVKRTT
jgi:hypothetical protein